MRDAGAVFQTFPAGKGQDYGLGARRAVPAQAEKPLSTLEIGLNQLGHVVNRHGAGV
jgi:hypothetical protein